MEGGLLEDELLPEAEEEGGERVDRAAQQPPHQLHPGGNLTLQLGLTQLGFDLNILLTRIVTICSPRFHQ